MTSENNGGKTSYYDLPLPIKEDIINILDKIMDTSYREDKFLHEIVQEIMNLFPKTLNDLIEHKNMKPWQHEVFKATYAIEERALKNPKVGSSKIREINKIIYYAERGLELAQKEAQNIIVKKPHIKLQINSEKIGE